MSFDITPRPFWPRTLSPIFEDDEMMPQFTNPSGLSVSEDEKNVYVEASLPGIDPKDVEITFDKGMLWIKGESKTEEKEKKYYRKAASSFSYRVTVPGEINLSKDPEAESNNGIMLITFAKSPQTQPKKISIKAK